TRLKAVRAAIRNERPVVPPENKGGKPSVDTGKKASYAFADEYIKSGRATGAVEKKILQQRADAAAAHLRDFAEFTKLPNGDREINVDRLKWIIANRKAAGPQPSKKEQEIMKILNSVLSVDFEDSKFLAVLEFLEDKTGQKLHVDKKTMEEVE